MRYLLAIFLPPIAVLLCGRPIQAVLNALLTLCFIIPGIIHALLIVSGYEAERRNRKILKEMKKLRKLQR
jgi:uncharacterized membrane protein YqaE (UPF0057 family)